ncbi:lipase 1-like [Ostrinia nubilalis]|uniref:lipase 1-like n=1 Tax=Ostrinia nubilalis TaxID=29057 RepID=UPI0030822297
MEIIQVVHVFTFFCILHLIASDESTSARVIATDLLEEGKLNFRQIVNQCGFECDVHEVVTHDGYVLTLFHIPGDKTRPVFLLSGNFGSADDYIARANISLPIILAKAGYDVWVGNWRGCKYGRRHLTLDPDRDRDQFWNFSFHEYGLYDVPANIDYVLNKTESKQLACIAWSMGTTAFYVLGTLRPDYNDKVSVLISLAPIGTLHHSVPLQHMIVMFPLLNAFWEITDTQEMYGENSTFVTVLRYVCRSEELGYELCMKGWIFDSFGADPKNLEREFTPVMFSHFPSSISTKAMRHMAQVVMAKRLVQYDYGPTENFERYGSAEAPSYELERNDMRVVLVSGKNDVISTLPDVELLKASLANVVEHVLLKPAEFSHFDFAYGRSSHKVLYKTHILGFLKKYFSVNEEE